MSRLPDPVRPPARLLAALVLLLAAGSALAAPLSLEQCLELAYANSPRLEGARQQVAAQREGILGSYGAFMPTFSASAGYGHQFVGPKPASTQYNTITQEFFVLDPIASRDYETYSFSLRGSWTLFSGLSRWADLAARKASFAAAEYDLAQTHHEVEGDVINAYYQLVRAQKMLALRRGNLEANREQYDQSRRAFAMGAVARSDTLRASVRYAEARLNLLEAENNLQLTSLTLATAIGLAPTRDLVVETVADPQIIHVERDRAIEAALGSHPQLLAGGERLTAARQGVRQAQAGFWPSLSAGYSFGWSDLRSPDNLGQMFDQDYTYNLSMGLSWSIFDGFRTRQATNQARASARIQEYNLEQQRRGVIQSVESTLVTLDNSRKRIELARATVALAEEDLRLARERYRVGAATLLEVTEAEVSLVQAQSSEIDGVTSYLIALAELERVTGLDLRGQGGSQ
ncbi:MAG: TolC family protein [Candidatus Krumholzibacteriota bacterium]|nr:TolC family protein [Candidatus Krumholzibacteriota bacterium]